jgi:hypothetical protein
MAQEYTNLFNSKALKNFPKLGFFGLKIYHLATLLFTSSGGTELHVCSAVLGGDELFAALVALVGLEFVWHMYWNNVLAC